LISVKCKTGVKSGVITPGETEVSVKCNLPIYIEAITITPVTPALITRN
jgi:hypothetical protein